MIGAFSCDSCQTVPDGKGIDLNGFIREGSDKDLFAVFFFDGGPKAFWYLYSTAIVESGGVASDQRVSHFIPFCPISSKIYLLYDCMSRKKLKNMPHKLVIFYDFPYIGGNGMNTPNIDVLGVKRNKQNNAKIWEC